MQVRALALSWLAFGMLLIGGVGAVHDAVVLILARAPIGAIIGTALAAAALGSILVVAASPIAVLATLTVRRWRWTRWPLSALAAGALAWWLLDPTRRLLTGGYTVFAVTTAAGAMLLTALAYARPPQLARVLALAIAVAVMVMDHWLLSPSTYLELHNLGQVIWIAAILAAGADLRRWFERDLIETPVSRLPTAILGGVAVAIAVCLAIDPLFPRWRAVAGHHSVAINGYIRATRTLIDFDRDGYSPVAWGADCDDFDSERHPRAIDAPGGGDENCNGVDPPWQPSLKHRGFTEEFGESKTDIKRVLLISVDTLRADALHPESMPRTWAFSERGIRFSRMYASSPSTFTSLPLLVRASEREPLLTEELQPVGVTATAIYAGTPGIDRAAMGFTDARRRGNAREVTEAALAHLEDVRESRHLLWLHYLDPHQPYRAPEATEVPLQPEHLPVDYRQVVAYTDRWLGELFDGLERLQLLSDTLIIFTSDHGEGFGEYGVLAHGRTAYDVVLRVPGFAVGPGLEPAVHEHLVSHRDVVPTILGAFGLMPEERFGRSWWRLRHDPEHPLHEWIFARSSRYSSGREVDLPLAILVRGNYKLVVSIDDDLATLYDLSLEGGEAVELSLEKPHLVSEMKRQAAVYADLDTFPVFMRAP